MYLVEQMSNEVISYLNSNGKSALAVYGLGYHDNIIVLEDENLEALCTHLEVITSEVL